VSIFLPINFHEDEDAAGIFLALFISWLCFGVCDSDSCGCQGIFYPRGDRIQFDKTLTPDRRVFAGCAIGFGP
jgi:hypothetical protein